MSLAMRGSASTDLVKAELRPMTRWVAVGFSLQRTITSARIARKVIDTGRTKWHVVNVRDPDEIDDQLLEWLTEAYDTSPD